MTVRRAARASTARSHEGFFKLLLGGAVLGLSISLSGCSSPSLAETSPEPSETATDAWSRPASRAPIQVTDTGPREGARGDARLNAAGATEYVVASGDVAIEISARFDVELDQLIDADGDRLGSYPTIYPGDVILFTERPTGIERDCFYGLPDLEQCREMYGY